MTQFIDVQNKKLLWDLLLNNGAFDGHTEENLPKIQSTFEYTITEIETSFTNKDLTEKNKEFLKNFVKKLSLLKNEVKQIIPDKQPEPEPQPYSGPELITAQELQDHRKSEFEARFNAMKSDFNNSIAVNKPKEIEFSDDKNDEPIKNMDDLLEKAAKERELILASPKTNLPEPINSKAVSFSDKVTTNDTELLREILKNQQIILEKLNKLEPKVL